MILQVSACHWGGGSELVKMSRAGGRSCQTKQVGAPGAALLFFSYVMLQNLFRGLNVNIQA